MVVETHWLAVGAFAGVLTLAWLFVERRITTTTLLAGSMWAYLAITAQDVTRYTQTGTEVSVPAGNIAYFCTALALLSFLALILSRVGLYPPEDEVEASDDFDTRTQGVSND